MVNAEYTSACTGVIPSSSCLPSVIDAATAPIRAAGSARSVARLHRVTAMRFPPESSLAALRSDTGTIAMRGASGSACCSRRYLRNAPAHIASTRSFNVTPAARRTVLIRPRSQDWAAKRRTPPIVTLNMVRGASYGNPSRCDPSPARAMRSETGASPTTSPTALREVCSRDTGSNPQPHRSTDASAGSRVPGRPGRRDRSTAFAAAAVAPTLRRAERDAAWYRHRTDRLRAPSIRCISQRGRWRSSSVLCSREMGRAALGPDTARAGPRA